MSGDIQNESRMPIEEIRLQLEIEKLRNENQKLELEIRSLRRLGIFRVILAAMPLLTALVAVGGLVFTLFQFRAELAKQLEERIRADRKPLWDAQLNYYFKAVEAAGDYVTAEDENERRLARSQFLKLYWGPLPFIVDIIPDEQESRGLIYGPCEAFARCLDGRDTCTEKAVQKKAIALGSAIQAAVGKKWKVKVAEQAGAGDRMQNLLPDTKDR
jgi:hypothetical protein